MNLPYKRLLSADSVCGTRVFNNANDELGKIEELMIDVESGKVGYAVLSFGGFLGIGDKFFAIPWSSLRVDENQERMILNVSKEKLETAPGFDKNNWPDFADPSFQSSIKNHYDSNETDSLNRDHIRKVI